jgi:hypothetical protein
VLANTVERIIRTPEDDEPSTEIEHGLYLIRGDNVVVCGEIDEKMDGDIDWSKVKGEVIRDTKNAWAGVFARCYFPLSFFGRFGENHLHAIQRFSKPINPWVCQRCVALYYEFTVAGLALGPTTMRR